MILWQIFWLFTRVAVLSGGGGPASLALMQRETVTAGWVTSDEIADAVALGNTLPGPSAPQVSAFVGYKLAGFWGAVAGAIGTVVPTTLLMLALVVYFYKIKDSSQIKAMLQAVRPAVVGFLLWTTYAMAVTVFQIKDGGWVNAVVSHGDKFLIGAVVFGLLTYTSVNPAVIILGAALVGWLFYR
jgi:chromate transporter